MVKSLLAIAAVLFFCSASYCQIEWRKFESSEHKFKVDFPAAIEHYKAVNPSDVGGYSYDFKSIIRESRWLFAVKVFDYFAAQPNPTDAQLRKRLDRSRDSAVLEMSEAKLKSERDIKLNDRLGREFVLENESFLIEARVYYFHNRLYLVTAMMRKSQPNSEKFQETATKFLDSFTIPL